MKWLVDVDFFVNLFKKYKKKKLTDIEIISSAVETESITDTIERHYDFHLNELQFVECHHLVKFLLRVLIFLRYLKNEVHFFFIMLTYFSKVFFEKFLILIFIH